MSFIRGSSAASGFSWEAPSSASPDSLASIVKGSQIVYQLVPIDTIILLPTEVEELGRLTLPKDEQQPVAEPSSFRLSY